MHTKQCIQCSKTFRIEDQDLEFYKKINVPEPKLCPECRSQRRLLFRNEMNLYTRACDLTGEKIISVYSADKSFPVYSYDAWYSDKWDGLEYGLDFDFNKSFFSQFKKLLNAVPRIALMGVKNENCPYINFIWNCKNCYMCFDMGFCENVVYSTTTYHSRDSIDCSFTNNSEKSYYLIDCENCYSSNYLLDCKQCSNAYFSFDCTGCNNVAFSSNLRNKEYYVFNKPVSPEEFQSVKEKILSGSYLEWKKNVNLFKSTLLLKAIHRVNHNFKSEQCLGDYILNSHNAKHCYSINACENVRYCNLLEERIKDSMDVDHASIGELMYEGLSVSGHNILFQLRAWPSTNTTYCDTTVSCSDCFGCVGLKHKKFCVLNKQYTEKDYHTVKEKIIEHMKKTGEWGEFFPPELSPFAYNETAAQIHYPLTKATAVARGYQWKDFVDNSKADNITLPDNIKETDQAICQSMLRCCNCGINYKIIIQEYNFYREMNLPIPRVCFKCRYLERFTMHNPRKLWERVCMCTQTTHGHNGRCDTEFSTTYSPDRIELVYCEACYQKEIY